MRLSLYNASIIAGIWKATAKQFVGRSISSPPPPASETIRFENPARYPPTKVEKKKPQNTNRNKAVVEKWTEIWNQQTFNQNMTFSHFPNRDSCRRYDNKLRLMINMLI